LILGAMTCPQIEKPLVPLPIEKGESECPRLRK
jgi:hypothetical protein